MYYTIGRSDDLKIIGYYPQTNLRKGYNPGPPDGHRQVHPYRFPDFIPNYDNIPDEDSRNKPTKTNKTTTPIYTK